MLDAGCWMPDLNPRTRRFHEKKMGTLILVRHGQARSFEKDSDRLSATGEDQARELGKFWLRRGLSFSEVYSGALVRQRRTAEIVGGTYIEAGLTWPEIQTTPELNEYDSEGILNRLVPAIAERDAKFRELLAAFETHRNSPERNRHFQKMFEVVTSSWLKGELEVEGVESWDSFSSRVRGALKRIVKAEGSGRNVAVFTSGGVIGLAVQTALDAPLQKALEINWRIKNCSLTEFIFSRDRLSLDSFNSIPHLDEPSLQTFR
jgi:broad specificity phosphatase PhoE